MARWTTRQEELIREWGHLGVEAVRERMLAECGEAHTAHAIEAHASRIHASLKVRAVCPECGTVGVALNRRTGLCPRCTEYLHVLEEAAFSEVLARERVELAEGGPSLEEARREYDALRQRNSRLRRKYGLTSRKGRGGNL